MKDIEITLVIDGEKKTFKLDFLRLGILNELMDIVENMKAGDNLLDMINGLKQFVLCLLKGQFTEQQLDDGIDYREFMTVANDLVDAVMNNFEKK